MVSIKGVSERVRTDWSLRVLANLARFKHLVRAGAIIHLILDTSEDGVRHCYHVAIRMLACAHRWFDIR